MPSSSPVRFGAGGGRAAEYLNTGVAGAANRQLRDTITPREVQSGHR